MGLFLRSKLSFSVNLRIEELQIELTFCERRCQNEGVQLEIFWLA